jgi:hypothetical protein
MPTTDKVPNVTDRRAVKVKQKVNTFAPALQYRVLEDDEVKFTKEVAFRFLEMKSFEGERPVRERHVQFLFDEYVSGRFLFQNVILATAKLPNDEEFRINGQHTCWMRVSVPERDEPLKNCNVRIMRYAVSDDIHLRQLYSAFDRGAPRTVAHIGKVLMMGSSCTDGVQPSLINAVIAGFRVFFSDDIAKRKRMSIEDVTTIIENSYGPTFNVVGRYIGTHERETRWVKRASVVGAMFSSFSVNVQESDNFWGPVFLGLNLEQKTDPRYQLRKYLESHGVMSTAGASVSQNEMYNVCVQMWNAWRDKESVQVVKPAMNRPKAK